MNIYREKLWKIFSPIKSYSVPYMLSTLFISMRNYSINWLNAILFSSIAYAARMQNPLELKENIRKFILYLIIFICVDTLSYHIQSITVEKMIIKIREVTYEKFLRAKPQNVFFQGENKGEVLSRLNNDVELIRGFFSFNLMYPMMLLISGIGGSINILTKSPIIGVYLILLGIVALLAKLYLSKKIFENTKKKQKYFSEMMAMLNQYVSNLPNIRMMNMVEPITLWILRRFQKAKETIVKQADLDTYISSSTTMVDIGIYAGVSILGVYSVRNGHLSIEQTVFILQLSHMVTDMFLSLGDSFANLKASFIGVDRIVDVLNLPPEQIGKLQNSETGTNQYAFTCSNLSVNLSNDVCIQYPPEILIPSQKISAIYGDSGCGKSTLGRMFVGLVTDYKGRILYSDKQIEEYTLASLRGSVTYVPQPDYFIGGTILENILLGNKKQISLEEIINIGNTLGCAQWIWDLPQNYNHKITYGGASLSGGQRQSLSIIRAVLRESQTIIFDETFSHLDRKSIQSVINGLKQLQKTIIIITHDQHIITACADILDLSRGDNS